MKMYIYKTMTALAGTLLLMNSCTLLSVDPISEIPQNKMWQNQRDVNAGIAEIYSSFRTALRTNWFSWGEMRSDNFVLYQELPSEYSKLILNQMTTDLPSTNWTTLYKVISNAIKSSVTQTLLYRTFQMQTLPTRLLRAIIWLKHMQCGHCAIFMQ